MASLLSLGASVVLLTATGCASGIAEGDVPTRLPEPMRYDGAAAATVDDTQPAVGGTTSSTASATEVAACGDSADGFEDWLLAFRRQAIAGGVPARTVSEALSGVTYDPEVIRLDRSQRSFKKTFAEFSASRVTKANVARGKRMLSQHASVLARIEARFGVPKELLVAIWGLETGYGANIGSMQVMRSLSTLAYDCRRSERFRGELLAALRIVARGDMAPGDMVGAWAGELGQTQFLPSSYERFALDFDGDGRADLLASAADVLASTANYLHKHGWERGKPFGPGTPNYKVISTWNHAEVYQRTIAHFAHRLGAR